MEWVGGVGEGVVKEDGQPALACLFFFLKKKQNAPVLQGPSDHLFRRHQSNQHLRETGFCIRNEVNRPNVRKTEAFSSPDSAFY